MSKDGGPAFPMQEPQSIHAIAYAAVQHITDTNEKDRAYIEARARAVGGMSLRDYFAAKVMQGLVSATIGMPSITVDMVARDSYEYADAMLKARQS